VIYGPTKKKDRYGSDGERVILEKSVIMEREKKYIDIPFDFVEGMPLSIKQ